MNHKKSQELYATAQKYIPGGVNSPVRSFKAVATIPIFAKSGKGALLLDEDNNEYIDYICSWGPLILGHSSDVARAGLEQLLQSGTTFGLPTAIEGELAREIAEAYENIDQVRMVCSGTEATMSAVRLARGYTNKRKIIKFEGCYHGHSDALLVKSGSGALTSGVPTSLGVLDAVANDTLVARYNDLDHVAALFVQYPDDIAAIIVEPVAANMGLVAPKADFLAGLRQLCDHYHSLLIFDEVITGFRVAYQGAGSYYGVVPDLTCLGKIVGGGMPVGAYGGKKEIMAQIAPMGGVYQAGTLSGNPVAMKMGLNTIRHLKDNPQIYWELEAKAKILEEGFKTNLAALNITNVTINRVSSLLCQFFVKGPVDDYQTVMQASQDIYACYFQEMLNQGILLPPAQYECLFLSTAHNEILLLETIEAHFHAMKRVKELWPEL